MFNCECFYCGSDIQLTAEQLEARLQLNDFRIVCQDCIIQLEDLNEMNKFKQDEQGYIPEEDLEPRDPRDEWMHLGQKLHDISREDTV